MPLSTIGANQIASGAVDTTQLASNAVTNAKLASGAVTAGDLPSGSVLQVVQDYKTDASSYAGSGVYHTIMSANITPVSTNSKILISSDVSYGYAGGELQYEWIFYFERTISGGSATKIGEADGANLRETGAFQPIGLDNVLDEQVNVGTVSGCFLDTPSTTSQITYALKFRSHTNTFYINRSVTDYDGTGFGKRLTSNFTLMEIAG
jgi:hypothetical protein